CDVGYKWFQAQRRYEDVPIHVIDVVIPPMAANLEAVLPSYVAYQTEGLRALIAFVETVTGRKMDCDRLSGIVDMAHESMKYWHETQKLRSAVPCPMPTEDHLVCFTPAYFMMGEPETLQFYKDLYAEVKGRVDSKMGVIKDEKFRLLWAGGLPPWHNLGIFNYFEDLGAVFVAETCYPSWDPYPDAPRDDIVEWIARSGLHKFTQYLTPYLAPSKHHRDVQSASAEALRNAWISGIQYPLQRILDMIEKYQVDGLVMHGAMSCRATTTGQRTARNMLLEHVNVPALFIESDIIDERNFFETGIRSQIDSFIENLANVKANRREI
ncbi:MAG: 2-hydroxyacyl-CoA dehydratase family protein, partial [Dehalococcoidia bacterium]|nr:2-hydroxyacyl-CoA dehydratase family protein [Dehalococcoidia bacterium]